MPAAPIQSEQEISDNEIDNNDFSKDLPFEAEYYRTSTDRDVFVRPIAGPESNEIDDGDDGIDLNDANTPVCTYFISINLFYESIDDFDLKLEGLSLQSNPKNITICEFLKGVKTQIFYNIKGKNFTNELVSDIIANLRQTFTDTFGYEDYCGVSTNVVTYFTKNDTQVDSTTIVTDEDTTEISVDDSINRPAENPTKTTAKIPNQPNTGTSARAPLLPTEEIPAEASVVTAQEQLPVQAPTNVEIQNDTEIPDTETFAETTTEIDGDTTEEYHSRTLQRPKLSDTVQDVIKVYKTLNNWKYSQQS